MHIGGVIAQTYCMKATKIAMIIAAALTMTAASACSDGQTGGGQNLGDDRGTDIVQQRENDGGHDIEHRCPHAKRPKRRIPPPRPDDGGVPKFMPPLR